MRGEYVPDSAYLRGPEGSPPHARGIPEVEHYFVGRIGITPACAGNTSLRRLSKRSSRDHPRMRGEYSDAEYSWTIDQGSPPHARGIP